MNIPIEVQTTLEMCLVTMCWWNQFKLGHLGNDGDEVDSPNAHGCKFFETLKMFDQTYQKD